MTTTYSKIISFNTTAGTHLLTMRAENSPQSGLTFAENPGVFAAVIKNNTGSVVWDTRTSAAAEQVPIYTPRSAAEVEAQILSDIEKYSTGSSDEFGKRVSYLACTTDPLAQTFFIDKRVYPNGVFLTGISLYFRTKDLFEPVFAEIRPTTNGYPSSSEIVPLTTVYKYPAEVSVSTNVTRPTKFNFPAPVYFAPGEYAIVTGSNSNLYTVYVAGVGENLINSEKIISSQPYVGSLFKSQNASTWTPEQNDDLTFVLHKAVFDTSNTFTSQFLSNSLPTSFNYHTISLRSGELDFGDLTDINYQIKFSTDGSLVSNYANTVSNKNIELGVTRTANVVGDITVLATLSTDNPDISPVIDLERLHVVAVKNIINSSANVNIPETAPFGGSALSKYVTRQVTLADGFDATGIRTILDVNRPAGTEVKVYAKVKSSEDNEPFDDKHYIELPLVPKSKLYTSGDDYMVDEYKLDNLSYVGNGTTYNTFKIFSIKIVLLTLNPAIVPKVKNLRVVATS